MDNNGTKDNVVEVGGREFKVVRKGLDEDQVTAFIDALIGQRDGLTNERDELLKREEHLLALTKLAERTVIEANKLTDEIKKEAVEKAKVAAEIEANKLTEGIKKEAVEQAKAEADKITARAGEQSQQQARQIYNQLLSQLEDLKQQVTGLQTASVSAATQVVSNTTPEPSPSLEASPEAANDKNTETPELIQVIGLEDRPELEENAAAPAGNLESASYEKEVELEILPPVNAMKIMELMRHLDSLPEVLDTELIPRPDKPSIIVSQREPILHLTDILKALPQVDSVKELKDGEKLDTGDGGEERKRRKIRITLSGVGVST